jgi:hypothetical protein
MITDFRIESNGNKRYIVSSSSDVLMHSTADLLELLALAAENSTNLIMLNETNFSPDFYNLKTGLAGEFLQKFSNYRMRVAILGTFSTIRSERFRELMHEANKGTELRFTDNSSEALDWLLK